MFFLYCCMLILVHFSDGFIAYDCSGLHMNITTISLIDYNSCDNSVKNINTKVTSIQLLQKPENLDITTYSCKVEIKRQVSYCGMHSHISMVQNGIATYIKEVGDQTCRSMIKTKTLSLSDTVIITDLKINKTIYKPLTLAGKLNIDGKCEGTSYSDFYGSWENVIVQLDTKITLKINSQSYNTLSNTLILNSGQRCNYNDFYCFDNNDGDTYWDILDTSSCNMNSIDVLYEGPATLYYDNITKIDLKPRTTYFVENNNILFALNSIKQINQCGQILYQTEHPRLFIIEDLGQGFYYKKRKVNVKNLDLFSYINTKYVYLEKHIETQMTQLYSEITIQRCKLEQQIIQSLLSIAFNNPNDFAYIYMKGPGYTAQVLGEVIHIIKCQPVEVTLMKTETCYQELPILYNNISMYMTPRNHLIISYGTERTCNDLLHPLYLLSGIWYGFNPNKRLSEKPHTFDSVLTNDWKYTNIKGLATDGIYSQDELDELRNHIMYPLEKPSIENIMVRNYLGLNPEFQGHKKGFFFTPTDIEELSEKLKDKLWRYLTNFGNITSGLFGIYFLYIIIKHLLIFTFNGISLYKTLGCGLHMLGLLFTSLTTLIITSMKKNDIKSENNRAQKDDSKLNIEEIQVLTTQPSSNVSPDLNIYPQIHKTIPKELL